MSSLAVTTSEYHAPKSASLPTEMPSWVSFFTSLPPVLGTTSLPGLAGLGPLPGFAAAAGLSPLGLASALGLSALGFSAALGLSALGFSALGSAFPLPPPVGLAPLGVRLIGVLQRGSEPITRTKCGMLEQVTNQRVTLGNLLRAFSSKMLRKTHARSHTHAMSARVTLSPTRKVLLASCLSSTAICASRCIFAPISSPLS
mmetsp:Transcript_29973/g.96149  ORF Transcript_29973/g.96149 Transcript_29973/m.96149 type:complete len:201 (-) Transcript_29973:435-1037(-)